MQAEAVNFTEQDAQAVGAVRNGDADRYRELVERHERRVYAVAWARLGDATLAEEATQEAFIRAYRRLWLLGDGAKFAGWIASIARHVAINFGLRHRRELNKRERWALEQAPEREDHPHATEADPPCAPETLRQTLADLPAAHRECLVLFYLEGKSGAEAAAALGISESALRVRLHRARAALRERLEGRLGDSLRKLGPGKTLVPAIMAGVLASSSAKAATAGGAVGVGVGANLLASFGKVIPFAALFPLLQVIASLPGLVFASWIGRMERRNFRDAEGFRSQMHKGFYRSFLWGFPLMIAVILFPIYFAQALGGMRAMYVWLVSFLVVVTLVAARTLTINRSPFSVGSFAYCCVITVGVIALALGWLPPALSALPMIVATILFTFMLGHRRPTRMDYNLFLRAGQGLLNMPATVDDTSPAKPLDRSSLLSFARFLGSRWLAVGYRWETRGLALRLPPVKTRFLANLVGAFVPMNRGCSRILLRPDGTLVTHCGEADAADLAIMKPNTASDPAGLEFQLATVVEHAWREFRDGDSAAAERALGELPESEVFVVSPPRAASTHWQRIFLGAAVLVMVVAMVTGWQSEKLRMVSGRHLKPVAISEADARAALALLGEGGSIGSNALWQARTRLSLTEVLPAKASFTTNSWRAIQRHLVENRRRNGGTAAQRLDWVLGSYDLARVVANGWFAPEDFSLPTEELRQVVGSAPEALRRRWFVPEEGKVASPNQPVADYTVLRVEDVARRVQCMKRFGCLDAVDGRETVELLLQHQVLSEQLPAGRRKLPFPKLAHGTFFTYGQDPIRDTYHALVVLEAFGALDRIDREACIQGILRFHHGRGLFGSVQQGDGFVIFGDTRDTFWAFESMRMLGALDRVKDLDRWQFRPDRVGRKPDEPKNADTVAWSEIEAWVCQQRLARILSERKASPQSPARSLLEP